MSNLIDNYIYLYSYDEFLVIPVYPDSISDSASASYGESTALSRSAPIYSYSHSGPRTVRITLALHRDLLEGVNINVSNMKVEINPEIIDEEVHRMIHQFEDQLKMQGIKLDDYMAITGMTHEKLHEQMEPEATKRIKYRYLLEAIADAEKIDFSEEEVQAKSKEMAENYGITEEELLKAYGSLDIVKYDMKMYKAIEILKENN